MKLSQVKLLLPSLENVVFKLQNGTVLPAHLHITEIGMSTKNFIDCGGTIRQLNRISFQLWHDNDLDHRLKPEKLLQIINLSEVKLNLEDADIEVEFQGDTIGLYDLAFDGNYFVLLNKTTACLALDKCGVPPNVDKNIPVQTSSDCKPGSACCS